MRMTVPPQQMRGSARGKRRSLRFVTASVLLVVAATSCTATIGESGARGRAGSGGTSAAMGGKGGSGGQGGSSAGGSGSSLTDQNGSAGSFVIERSKEVSGSDAATGCKNLQCQQHKCGSGATTISGQVFDPSGRNPLYNVAVYVPNEPVQPLRSGASCDKCEAMYSGKAVASTLSDADGHFKLDKAPDGDNIPLVIQIGKWRKQVTLPKVARCEDTAVPKALTTLPRNHKEGDIPNIAISTGSADTLECLLRRVGVDASEYTPGEGGEGRVHIFQGSPRGSGRGGRESPNTSPAAPRASQALWTSADALMAYDVVLLSCEGQETVDMNQQAMHDYADRGGRVFASHYHYAWFNTGPYAQENLANWTTGSQDVGNIDSSIVTSFPKGKALQKWLMDNNALQNGLLPIEEARNNAEVTASHEVSQPWIIGAPGSDAEGATQYFSFNTPTAQARVPDGQLCGRVVFSDLHVGAASNDDPSMPVPTGCSDVELSPQEKALEFMLFDLSACVIPDDVPPAPPPMLN